MPYLRVRVVGEQHQGQADEIAKMLTNLTVTVLKKARPVVAIDLAFVPAAHWYIGGQAVADTDKPTFFLEIKLTEGTNTREQKAQFLTEVYSRMTTILGDLNEASYVVIQDVNGNSWGFGGQTQEFRYIQSQLN
ncbi:tautomerase family protein [Furfurilactobacillus sp. WILCCON 0119]